MKPLYTGMEWDFKTIEKTWKAINKIGKGVFGLDYYAPQIEMINAEQMLDAYSSVAMPIMYNHWSFGKSFIQNQKAYQQGQMGLAYEVVINTNPTLTYLMEDNTMTLQTLVMAHAACGHGSFFKTNYLFKQWTDADAILDYLKYAKEYIAECEERYGAIEVESFLDACHSLQNYGVDKYKRPGSIKHELKRQRDKANQKYTEQMFNDLWRTVPPVDHIEVVEAKDSNPKPYKRGFPEENILYFLEKQSYILQDWQREVIRIVRKVAQYFYPQMQTQVMNEGWACFIHYHIMMELYDQKLIGEGSYLEFLAVHTAVVRQGEITNRGFPSINPYALGFAMMMDIKRICQHPTEEDREWFPNLVDTDWLPTMKDIIANYRDESFILQFLSPKVMRDFKLFTLHDSDQRGSYIVSHVHTDEDFKELRMSLSKQYNLSYRLPQMEVVGYDWDDDNQLNIIHKVDNNITLDYDDSKLTCEYISRLWGYRVHLDDVNIN